MFYDEFPHTVIILRQEPPIPDGLGGFTVGEFEEHTIAGFVDTPKTFEKFNAQKLEHSFDRYLYLKNADGKYIDVNNDRVFYQNILFDFASDLEDQGGMGEIYRVALRKVSNAD